MFNEEIKAKSILNGAGRCTPKKYVTKFGDNIIVQGSYEMAFVVECENLDIPIKNGPVIKYSFNGKTRNYFVDFLIVNNGQNKLVEIKSTYYFDLFKEEILAKKEAAEFYCSERGISYELKILDKTRKERQNYLDVMKSLPT